MNKSNDRKLNLVDDLIYLCITIFFIWNLLSFDYSEKNFIVIFSFFVLGIFYYLKILTAKKNITLYRVFYIFCFIFMFYAPLQQYLSGTVFQNKNGWMLYYDDHDYLQANIILIVFTALFEVGYHLTHQNNQNKKVQKKSYVFSSSDVSSVVMIVVSLVSVSILGISGNIIGRTGYNIDNQNISNQINNILRFIPVSCLILTILQRRQNFGSRNLLLLIFLLEIVVVFFPLNGSMARYLLFGTYMALFSLFFSESRYKSMGFLIYVIGFFFVFSAFNYFKTHTITDLSGFSLSLVNFNFVDFDAYQMLMASINYVEKVGLLWGENIITAMLCFIPRSIWSGKLYPSGQIVAEYWGTWYTNLSCPIMAELFLAFGYAGVVLGAFSLGIIFKKIDGFDYSRKYFEKGFFCLLSGLLIYVLRGALLPVVSYLMALIISLAIIGAINKYCSKVYFKRTSIKKLKIFN